MVLNPSQPPKESRAKHLGDLASELGSDAQSIRDNEGEAANYGVYFDDTEYDYMQHLRDIGQGGGGEAVFVEANPVLNRGKGKQKESLEDALRQLDLENRSADLLDEQILPSKNLPRASYEAQQDVPDAIAGLQPDMDPRLREVLEALDDEAYVDDDDDDIFQELAKGSGEIDEDEFDETYDDMYPDQEDEDGWESDDTAKPAKEFKDPGDGDGDDGFREVAAAAAPSQPEVGPSQDWMKDFEKFKKDQKSEKKPAAPRASPSELQSSIWTTTTSGGRRKKRKGALTDASGYSMTSSSLVRTEQMSILDTRFDKIDEEYSADVDDAASVSVMSAVSSVQGPTRSDFDGLLDDFLGGYSMQGKKKVQKGKWNSGTEQLDEIRKGLGPARVQPKYR